MNNHELIRCYWVAAVCENYGQVQNNSLFGERKSWNSALLQPT